MSPGLRLACLGLAVTVLTGCAGKPHRVNVEWDKLARPVADSAARFDVDSPRAAQAVQVAAKRIGLVALTEQADFGFFTFTKVDERYANAHWILNASVSERAGGGSVVRYRTFVFTSAAGTQPMWGPRALPSDGTLEREFKAALEQNLGAR